VLTVTAQDAAGNTATATLTVSGVDARPPTVAITSPTSASTYSTSSSVLTLAGTAADNVGVTQVTWANSRGGSGVASGTTSWTASGILLQIGTNVLTVTARDAAGNVASVSVTVTRGRHHAAGDPNYLAGVHVDLEHERFSAAAPRGSFNDVGVTHVAWINDRGQGNLQ